MHCQTKQTFKQYLKTKQIDLPKFAWPIVDSMDEGKTLVCGVKTGKYILNKLWKDYQREVHENEEIYSVS